MKKVIALILLITLANCGFKPMLSISESNFSIYKIEYSGALGRQLNNNLKQYHQKKGRDHNYSLVAETAENKEITLKEYRYSAKDTDSMINLKWWDLFKDPVLDTLIVTALRENKDALIAASRIEQARANVSFTKADMGPKITVSGGASRGDLVNGVPINSFRASTGINWELDFWGKFSKDIL